MLRRELRPPRSQLSLTLPYGQYHVEAWSGIQRVEALYRPPPRASFQLTVRAPAGQDSVQSGSTVLLPDGEPVRVSLTVQPREAGTFRWQAENQHGSFELQAEERGTATFALQPGEHELRVEHRGEVQRVLLYGESVPIHTLRSELRLVSTYLPALADGRVDATLPSARIQLPALWWAAVLDRFGLGFRVRDDQAPRTFLAVTLANDSTVPINVVISAAALGEAQRAFRPRFRDESDLTSVRRLVRIPPGEQVAAALPIYLDREALPKATQLVPFQVEVRSLGSARPLHRQTLQVAIQRGSGWATAGFVLLLLVSTGGWLLVARNLSGWLARPTHQLTTIAVFGALSFTVGAASQVLGLGIASVLGPFAPFVIGLVDDVMRMCLMAALLSLVPRVGVASLAMLTGWLMRAVTLGAAHPVDFLYLGAAVGWTEAALYGSGVTRVVWVNEARWRRLLRLVGGLAVPHAIGTGAALAVSVVLYRLYYADWYVVALVLFPGFLYAMIGCVLAVPFASLARRVT